MKKKKEKKKSEQSTALSKPPLLLGGSSFALRQRSQIFNILRHHFGNFKAGERAREKEKKKETVRTLEKKID